MTHLKSSAYYKTVSENIIRNLKELMKSENMILTAGEKMDLNRTALRDILLRTRSPRYETLLKIADYFQVDLRRLTQGENYDLAAGDNELQMLVSQLSEQEINFLKASAKTLLSSRNSQP